MIRRVTPGVLLASLALTIPVDTAWAQSAAVAGKVTAKGLPSSAGIVVSLEAPGLKVTPPPKPVEMDQRRMQFLPHVLPVVRGTTVRFLNNDRFGHNVFSPEGGYDLGNWTRGQTRDYTFTKSGVYTQLCRLHSAMAAVVVVLDTPYFATTDVSGAFEMTNVPAGKYTLVARGEKLKPLRQAISVQPNKPVTVALTLAN
jgi:plastocyanin